MCATNGQSQAPRQTQADDYTRYELLLPGSGKFRILYEVTEPVLMPFRRVIPRIGMLDLSPLAALLVIQFLQQRIPDLLR